MLSLRPGPNIRIVATPKLESVEKFCSDNAVQPQQPDSEGYYPDQLGNISRKKFLLTGAKIKADEVTNTPIISERDAKPEHYDGMECLLRDFTNVRFIIRGIELNYQDFYEWRRDNNRIILSPESELPATVKDLNDFLTAKGVSSKQRDQLQRCHYQNLTSPFIARIKAQYGNNRFNFSSANQIYYNFDTTDEVQFETRTCIEVLNLLSVDNETSPVPGVIVTQGHSTVEGPMLDFIGASNPLLENLIAEKDVPQTFEAFQEQAALYQAQETAAQQHYQSLYSACEPLLTRLNSAYTAEVVASETAKPRIMFASDILKVIYPTAIDFDIRKFTNSIVNDLYDQAEADGGDSNKLKKCRNYYYDQQKKPGDDWVWLRFGAVRKSNSATYNSLIAVIEAAKAVNQAYAQWSVDPLDMQRLKELKLCLISLKKVIVETTKNTNVPAKFKEEASVIVNHNYSDAFQGIDNLIAHSYESPVIRAEIKRREQMDLLSELSPFEAAMRDEAMVMPLLRLDAHARKNPKNLALQIHRLQPGQHAEILKSYSYSLEVQEYFAQEEFGVAVLLDSSEKEKSGEKSYKLFTQAKELSVTKIGTNTLSNNPKIGKYRVRDFLTSISKKGKLKSAIKEDVQSAGLHQIFFDNTLLSSLIEPNDFEPNDFVKAKEKNFLYALTQYPISALRAAYDYNAGTSLAYVQTTKLYYWLTTASQAEIAAEWDSNPAISKMFALDPKIAEKLMQDNIHAALFFMENGKARKQAQLQNTNFEACYDKHKNSQKFMDLLISNRLYKGWDQNKQTEVEERSSGIGIFRKPLPVPQGAETSEDSYSYLISKKRFNEVKPEVTKILEFTDAQALTVLFKSLTSGKAGKLQNLKQAFNSIIAKALNPDTIAAETDKEALKLAVLVRTNPDLALALAEYLEKQYYAANEEADKTQFLNQLVELACADRSRVVAEKVLKTNWLIRTFTNRISNSLSADQRTKIANVPAPELLSTEDLINKLVNPDTSILTQLDYQISASQAQELEEKWAATPPSVDLIIIASSVFGAIARAAAARKVLIANVPKSERVEPETTRHIRWIGETPNKPIQEIIREPAVEPESELTSALDSVGEEFQRLSGIYGSEEGDAAVEPLGTEPVVPVVASDFHSEDGTPNGNVVEPGIESELTSELSFDDERPASARPRPTNLKIRNWYNLVLISLADDIVPDLSNLEEMSKKHSDSFVLIKQNEQLSIYGWSDQDNNWKVEKLKSDNIQAIKENLVFPASDAVPIFLQADAKTQKTDLYKAIDRAFRVAKPRLRVEDAPVVEVVPVPAQVVEVGQSIMAKFCDIADSKNQTALMDFWYNDESEETAENTKKNREQLFTLPAPAQDNYLFQIFEKIKTQPNPRWFINKLTIDQMRALFNNTKDIAKFRELCEFTVKRKEDKKINVIQDYFDRNFNYRELISIYNDKQNFPNTVNIPNAEPAQVSGLLQPIKNTLDSVLTKKSYEEMIFDSKKFTDEEIVAAVLDSFSRNINTFEMLWSDAHVRNTFLLSSNDEQLSRLLNARENPVEKCLQDLLDVGELDADENKKAFNKIWQRSHIQAKILRINTVENFLKFVAAMSKYGDETSRCELQNKLKGPTSPETMESLYNYFQKPIVKLYFKSIDSNPSAFDAKDVVEAMIKLYNFKSFIAQSPRVSPSYNSLLNTYSSILLNKSIQKICLASATDEQLATILSRLTSAQLYDILLSVREDAATFNKIWQQEPIRTKILEITDSEKLAQLVLAIESVGDETSKELLKNASVEKLAAAFNTMKLLTFQALCSSALIKGYLEPGLDAAGIMRDHTPAIAMVEENQEAKDAWNEFRNHISTAQQIAEDILLVQAVVGVANNIDAVVQQQPISVPSV